MTSWHRRLLALLLLVLVATSSLLSLLQDGHSIVRGDFSAPYVLVEEAEASEADEFDDSELLLESAQCVVVLDVACTAHIAEELEFDRVRRLRSHFERGPPTA